MTIFRKRLTDVDWQNLTDNALLTMLTTMALLAVGISALMNLLGFAWWDGLLQNFATEMAGALITFLLFEKIIGVRDRLAEKEREHIREVRELVRRVGSISNPLATDAVDALRQLQLLLGDQSVLVGKDLRGAELANARLWSANLARVNLEGANLAGAKLSNAQLTRATLTDAVLTEALLRHTDLTEARMHRADLTGVIAQRCDLSGADLKRATLERAVLRQATLHRTKFNEATLRAAKLHSADLTEANLREANLSRATLHEAQLNGANLSRVNLYRTRLRGADLRGALLRGANLMGAEDADHARYDVATVLPDAHRIGKDAAGQPLYNKYWNAETDMARYTDHEHPDFWLPQWAAAGFHTTAEWKKAEKPAPWAAAGYQDHAQWWRDQRRRPSEPLPEDTALVPRVADPDADEGDW